MVYRHSVLPLFDSLTHALSLARARLAKRQFEPLGRWTLLHIDQNGELQRATVDVLEAIPQERLIVVRPAPEAAPLILRVSRIIEAVDVPTGRKVILDRWMARSGR